MRDKDWKIINNILIQASEKGVILYSCEREEKHYQTLDKHYDIYVRGFL